MQLLSYYCEVCVKPRDGGPSVRLLHFQSPTHNIEFYFACAHMFKMYENAIGQAPVVLRAMTWDGEDQS